MLSGAIPEVRKKLDEYWGEAQRAGKEKRGEHSPVTEAVAEANRTMPKSRATSTAEPKEVYGDLANDELGSDAPEEQRSGYSTASRTCPSSLNRSTPSASSSSTSSTRTGA